MNKLSENLLVKVYETTDIGGTNIWGSDDTLGWVSLAEADIFMAIAEIGTWDATDTLDTCVLQQATDSSGTGVKVVTGKSITPSATVADGQTFIFDCKAADLDTANSFTHVRLYIAESDDTGTDNVTCSYVRGNVFYKKEDLNSATQSD